MYITFEQLRKIKHSLPTGSVKRIASELNMEEQSVRNFFGARKQAQPVSDWHHEPGPDGGLVRITNPSVLEAANRLIEEQSTAVV